MTSLRKNNSKFPKVTIKKSLLITFDEIQNLTPFQISQALFYYSSCLTSLSVEYLSSGIIISCKYRARIRSEPISPREVGLTGTRENHLANKSRLFISSNGINIWAENTK